MLVKNFENYVDTWIRIYKDFWKIYMTVPSAPNSVELAIKRAHLQIFTWLRCCQRSIGNPNPEWFDWQLKHEDLKSIWFNEDQFPPTITKTEKSTKELLQKKALKKMLMKNQLVCWMQELKHVTELVEMIRKF